MTACFIDIASFTRASEAADGPERLAADLGRCLRRLDAEVTRHRGFVDKYLGDGLLALFGLEDGDGRGDAVAAVRACIDACRGPGAPRLAGHRVRLRAGLAWGVARIGALHDGPRPHFTAVGDAVNVAARLEQMNRTLGTRVLAAAEVAAAVPGEGWVDHGEQSLRGRERRVRVFELTEPGTRL